MRFLLRYSRFVLVVLLGTLLGSCVAEEPQLPTISVVEAGIPELQAAMEGGAATSRELVAQYLTRIALYEDRLNAAVSINPNALKEAEELDRERAEGRVRGPLHGIPVALKDNIQTTHLPTTGGALAFAGYVPPYEATLTANLRAAGAIIIAKAGLTEFANWMGGAPTPMPGNYNSLTGFAFNPYDPRRDPRGGFFDGRSVLGTGGSSSGVGTAASFWTANVGTDTGGSVISPSNRNMLVGIRPTLGRISRWGIAPVTLDHDTAGPMARTVADAAIMLGAMEGDAPDPNDPATDACTPPPGRRPISPAKAVRGRRPISPAKVVRGRRPISRGRTAILLQATESNALQELYFGFWTGLLQTENPPHLILDAADEVLTPARDARRRTGADLLLKGSIASDRKPT